MSDNQETYQAQAIGTNAIILLLLPWLVRILILLFPESNLWGFNHLLFIDSIWITAMVILGLAGLLSLFIPAFDVKHLIKPPAEFLFGRGNQIRWAILSLLFLIFFWLLRLPVNLLGDGQAMISDIGNDLPVIFKWTETGAIRFVYLVYLILPVSGLEGAQISYTLVSVVSGGAVVFFFAGIAFEIGRDAVVRFTAFCLLLFSGWTLLFFGYAENYPVVWPFVTGYIYFVIKYIKNGFSLAWPFLFLLVAVVMHLQVLFFLPTILVLLFGRGKGRNFYNKFKRQIIVSILALILMGVVLFIYKYCQSLEFRIHFLPLFAGRPALPDYTVFSLRHLLDIFNEFSLLIPIWPVMLLLSWRCLFRKAEKNQEENTLKWFLGIFSICGLVFLLILDPKLGMSRDWDLFALSALGPLLFILLAMNKTRCATNKLYPAMIIIALATVLPFFAVNLSYQPTIEYYNRLLDHEYPRSESGMVSLLHHYRRIGDDRAGDSLNVIIRQTYARSQMEEKSLALANDGRYDEALRIADSMHRADPYSSNSYNIRGMIYFFKKDYPKAILEFEQALRLAPQAYRILVNLALTYHRQGQLDKMMSVLKRAQRLAPEYNKLYEAFAMGFFTGEQYDSSLVYARYLIESDPQNEGGYLIAGVSHYKFREFEQAEIYLEQYLLLNPQGEERQIAEGILKIIQENKNIP